MQNLSKKDAAEKAPRPARRRKKRWGNKTATTHIDLVGLRGREHVANFQEKHQEQLRCDKGKCSSASEASKFEHKFSYTVSSILYAEDLWERVSSAGTINAPSSSPSKKRILSWSADTPQKRNLLSDFLVFKWLKLADLDNCFGVSEKTFNLLLDTIIFKNRATESWHLALVSNTNLADREPALQWILTGLLCAGLLDSSQKWIDPLCIPVWSCSHENRNRKALRAHSSSGIVTESGLRLVLLLSHDVPGSWDRGTQWLGSRYSVQICSTILLNQGHWNQKLYLFPKKWRGPRSSQQFAQFL